MNAEIGYPTLHDVRSGHPVLAPDGRPFSTEPGRPEEILDMMGRAGALELDSLTSEQLHQLHLFSRNVRAYLGLGRHDQTPGAEGLEPRPAETIRNTPPELIGKTDQSRTDPEPAPGDSPPDDPRPPPNTPPFIPVLPPPTLQRRPRPSTVYPTGGRGGIRPLMR